MEKIESNLPNVKQLKSLHLEPLIDENELFFEYFDQKYPSQTPKIPQPKPYDDYCSTKLNYLREFPKSMNTPNPPQKTSYPNLKYWESLNNNRPLYLERERTYFQPTMLENIRNYEERFGKL